MNEQEIMLTAVRGCRRVDLIADPRDLTDVEKMQYDRMRMRRVRGEPLQYILGECDFMGVSLSVDARALIPRPETEILAEIAIDKIKKLSAGKTVHVLDLGTGTGNITIAIAKKIPNAALTAIDIDQGALTLALGNARANGVGHRIEFLRADMGAYLRAASRRGNTFDIVISNPPYIPTPEIARLPDEVRREPRLALDGGKDGLRFLRTIIRDGPCVLSQAGHLLLEFGDGQRDDIKTIFKHNPAYRHVRVYKDYAGTDRIMCARRKGLWSRIKENDGKTDYRR